MADSFVLNPGSPVQYVTSDPNGVVTAPRGTIAVNTTTRATYQNTDGGTTWVQDIYSQASNTLTGSVISPPWAASRYYFCPNNTPTTSTALTNTQMRASPFYVPNTVTVTRVGAEVTTVGEAGSKVRLGIYADDGTGRPGALVLDAGQIAGDSATVQEITGLSATIGPGWYWSAWAVQSAPTTVPTLRAGQQSQSFAACDVNGIPNANQSVTGFQQSGVSGALPNPFGVPSGGSGIGTRIFIKT